MAVVVAEEKGSILIVDAVLSVNPGWDASGCNRFLTVYKKERSSIVSREAVLRLSPTASTAVSSLLQRWPVTTRERQDLLPPTDRDRLLAADLRELGLLRSLGRLTPAAPQVPPPANLASSFPSSPLGGHSGEQLSATARHLPVWRQQQQILAAVGRSQVTLVCGETGSGKTTQVPQMLLSQATAQCRPVRVLVTQPRRLSALTVAERVAAERGEKLGTTVGYQIRLESKLCPKTLLTFCTNGVLLRTLMAGESALATITHVIVDEIHERDRFADFLLTALKDCLPKFQHLKLILMSAAMDVGLYSRYFGGCPVIDIPGQCYPVKEYFLEDVLMLTNYNTKSMAGALKQLESHDYAPSTAEDWTRRLLGSITSSAVPPQAGARAAAAAGGGIEEKPSDRAGGEVTRTEVDKDKVNNERNNVLEPDECAPNSEMDDALEAAYLTGSDDSFAQMLYLIMSEDVSPDYQHSVTMASPLMVSAGRGRTAVLEQLASLGATLTLRSSDGRTALGWARSTGQSEAADLLRCLGASEGVVFEDDHDASTGALATAAAATASDSSQAEQQKQYRTQLGLPPPPPAEPLSPEDQKKLQAYLMTSCDELADVDLVCSLCYYVHSTQPPGALLVFLPGYDSITQVRDCIEAEEAKYTRAGGRVALYCLHSSMQSAEQKRVFRPPPPGTRKVILSTNIAETSVTIDDVVYVINSGKIKEVNFDSMTGASCLKEVWASQASAVQRRGRAGRCQPGVAYHLFSRTRYASLPPYQTPEILRVPLQELCLHTKLLAPANVPIADFLTRAPDPPSLAVVRSAVQLLKSMEAIDGWEEVTALGHHLLELPLPPRLGKMVLVATILKCLDPVLTIAACLAHKDPFVLPRKPTERLASNQVKKAMAGSSMSDHLVLVRAVQQWQRAHAEGSERRWCARNYVSSATMEMISGIRSQVLAQLKGMGFVRPRGPQGDIRDCNINSDNWGVVKAAIVAGMYPNLIRVDREQLTLRTLKHSQVRLHTSCCLYDMQHTRASGASAGDVCLPSMSRLAKKDVIRVLPSDYLVFEEMVMTGVVASARTVTVVSPVTVLLMAGPTRLPLHALSTAVTDDGSDSESEQPPLSSYGRLRLDDWVQFVGAPDSLQAALQLRHKLHAIMLRRFKAPGKGAANGDDDVVRVVATVLAGEETRMNAGDSPAKPESFSFLPSSHRSSPAASGSSRDRDGNTAPSPNSDHVSSSKDGPGRKSEVVGVSASSYTATAAASEVETSSTPNSPPKAATSTKTTAATNAPTATTITTNSAALKSAQGIASNSSTPTAAPSNNRSSSKKVALQFKKDTAVEQAASSLKTLSMGGSASKGATAPVHKPPTATEPVTMSVVPGTGEGAAGGTRYFIIRASGYRQLDAALHSGLWTFADAAVEAKIAEAAHSCVVVLIFGHALSAQLHACARLEGRRSGGDWGPWQLEWVSRLGLPLQVTRNLHNSLNDNLQIHATKSGQEIDTATGDHLLELWQKQGSSVGSAPRQQDPPVHHHNQPYHRGQHHLYHNQGFQHHHQSYHHDGGQGQGGHPMGGPSRHPNSPHHGQGYGQRYIRGGGYGYGGGYRGSYRGGGYRR